MGRWKEMLATVCIGLMLSAAVTGCGTKDTEPSGAVIQETDTGGIAEDTPGTVPTDVQGETPTDAATDMPRDMPADAATDMQGNTSTDPMTDIQGSTSADPITDIQGDTSADPTTDTPADAADPDRSDAARTGPFAPEQASSGSSISAGQEYLSGKVIELHTDGFLFARTVLTTASEDGHGSFVTFLDEEEAEKITVKYAPDTRFERWTIKGGGADIQKEAASASAITEGMGLELCGHFEGSDLIAELVLIEVYE